MRNNSRQCAHPGCSTRASLGFEYKKPVACAKHREPGMINVNSKRCAHPGCKKQPSFGFLHQKPVMCAEHQEIGMINVTKKHCAHSGCCLSPSFGIEDKNPIMCAEHREPGMRDVTSKHCAHPGCEKNPYFGFEEKKPIMCAKHSEPDMRDVKKAMCQHASCIKRATKGIPGYKPAFCAGHATKDMIYQPRRRCIHDKCNEKATYGVPGRLVVCEQHALPSHINLALRPCKSCGLEHILDRDDLCHNCNPFTVQRVLKAKELAMVHALESANLHATSYDMVVDRCSCGKERPDAVFDVGSHIVIVECDEHQHSNYACECEQARMVNIGQTFGGLRVVFLRFNPDKYSPRTGSPVTIKRRHEDLARCLRFYLDEKNVPCALVSAVYLFYDGDDLSIRQSPQILMNMD